MKKKIGCLHSLQKAKIWNPDCKKSGFLKYFYWNPKGICKKLLHAKNQTTATPNDSFMTKNKLIIEAMKIGGCSGHVTLMK